MASFKAETGRDRLRIRGKKKLSFRSIQTRPGIGNSKKIQKMKKHHYGFFPIQNRTGQAENERKKVFSLRSIPTHPGIRNSKKIAKKIKIIKKHNYGFFSSQNGTRQVENEGKKKIVTIYSNPTRNREFQKK